MAITEYINSSGKLIVIRDMPDAYLLNSYAHYRKRADKVKSTKLGQSWWLDKYLKSIYEVVDALRAEIDRRGLV